ncbi:MAG: MFS transporter [Bacillota bacterium]
MQKSSKNWITSVLVLASGWLLLYATRTVLSSALKDIGDYWGLSQSWLGILSSSFFLSYTVLQIPSGFLADKFGSRAMLVAGFAVQSAGLILGSLSQNHIQFLASRLLTGMGQATYFACQQAIVSIIVPKAKKALGTALGVAGAGVGGALGFFVGKILSVGSYGWRMPFIVLGVTSMAFVGAVLLAVPEPKSFLQSNGTRRGGRDHALGSLPDTCQHDIEANAVRASNAQSSTFFMVSMCMAHFMTMYGFYLMLTWLPYYLETVKGLDVGLSTTIPVIMSLVMSPATVLAGYLFGRLKDKTLICRIALPVSALAVMLVPLAGSTAILALALATYGATGKLVIDPSFVYYVGESSPPEKRGTVFAVFNMAGAVAMTVAPAVTGFVAQATGSFDGNFYVAGAFNLAGLACFLAGVRMFSQELARETEP